MFKPEDHHSASDANTCPTSSRSEPNRRSGRRLPSHPVGRGATGDDAAAVVLLHGCGSNEQAIIALANRRIRPPEFAQSITETRAGFASGSTRSPQPDEQWLTDVTIERGEPT